MEENLINIIDYERAWKKTLLYKFGKKTPSQSWKNQYDRINEKKFGKKITS